MTAELFTLDRPKLRLVSEADPMGLLDDVTTAAQACRAAFVAAEVGALDWDRERWPDLLFGVWTDAPVPASGAGRRRRTGDSDATTELNTWLHLRPTWPQLGGPSIHWPLPDPALSGRESRIEQIAEAVLEALNTTFRRTMLMAHTLTETTTARTDLPPHPPTQRNGSVLTKADSNRIALTEIATDTPQATDTPTPTDDAKPVDPPGRRTFTASGFAASHAHVGDVLAGLANEAEAVAARTHEHPHDGIVAHIGHAITPVAPSDAAGRHGFLVTVTATIDARPRQL